MNPFKNISKFLKKKDFPEKTKIYGIPSEANAYALTSLMQSVDNDCIIAIVQSNTEAENLYRECLSFLPNQNLLLLTGFEGIPYDYANVPTDIKQDRIRIISKIMSGFKGIICSSVSGFIFGMPTPENIRNKYLTLKKGQEFNRDEFVSKLESLGYEREIICEKAGQYTVKGGIVDVFVSSSEDPVRLDFFGDTIEEIKTFSSDTQKSLDYLNEFTFLPINEYILNSAERGKFHTLIESARKTLSHLPPPDSIPDELFFLVHDSCGILSLFQSKPLVCIPDENSVKEALIRIHREYNTLYERRNTEFLCVPPDKLLQKYESSLIESTSGISFSRLQSSDENSLVADFQSPPNFKGKIREARAKIQEFNADGNATFIITTSFQAQRQRLEGLFREEGAVSIRPDSDTVERLDLTNLHPGVHLAISELRNGFSIPSENLHIWTDNDIFGRAYKRKSRYKKVKSSGLTSFIELKEGDYVVHINHGIGRFVKIEKTTADNRTRDFLKLEYAGGDTLFVPLDQISLVQKYMGGLEHPTLDTLGKNSWKKKRDRVGESIEKLAEDLIQLYAGRMSQPGYAYPSDSIWQEEFEAEFEYEETPDQLSAIEAVKTDLETPRPMDRLICGDVGYGKTEVAIRAAFKVIMAGRQVVLIVPTTILALQHFNTFKSRFQNYPITLELVSRFRTAKETSNNLKLFSEGKIDMLIGTHALLSGTKGKNLGLLIIDEEQRFGVNHKEAIKKLKSTIDVLTMTATPIPRTLHMSLAGIRDLSIIETPPKNRQSVETYVMEDNEEIIVEAIKREFTRDGQVFFLYNRIEDIEQEADALYKLIPEASIAVLHGRMLEDEVEEVLIDFYHKKYNLLVTTTIIESGIDMPNVNTIIIKRSDAFGLSQLYQIRGRVGRSDRKAYAYLLYPSGKALTEQAEKRLNTIYEYQELGSGFKVAMRDLEIRGAGNLLGSEQSGDIMEIGFELYIKLLEEAIARLRKEDFTVEIRTALNLKTNFYIPDQYIPDTKQKIEFYKKFEAAGNLEEVDAVFEEMQDRFGAAPENGITFMMLEKIRTQASLLGFESVSEHGDEIRLKSGKNFTGSPEKIIKLINLKSGLYIKPNEPNVLFLKIGTKDDSSKLKTLMNLLIKISPDKKE